MSLLFYIQVKPINAIAFGNPYSDWVRDQLQKVELLEADNHSTELVINHEITMLTQTKKAAMIIEAEPVKPGLLIRLFEKFIRTRLESSLVIINGENGSLEKMLKMVRGPIVHDQTEEQIKRLLADFYS